MFFDTELFAQLLDQAKGNRSINKYASDVDVSPAHISRLLRGLLTTPPSPETIKKLAHGAYNRISYDELMRAAGHINTNYDLFSEDDTSIKYQELESEKRFVEVIVSELYSSNLQWSINKPAHKFPDLIISITNGEYTEWYIEIKKFNPNNMNNAKSRLYQTYGQISVMQFSPKIKFTIAVDTEAAFELLVHEVPRSLKVNLFAMLFDLEGRKIIKEEQLCHY